MSSDDIAISVSNLSKRYEIYNKPGDRLKQFVIPKLCRAMPFLKRWFFKSNDSQGDLVFFNEFWALKDVSFEIKKGETVGIIGRNGSGKSTLLQLICGILNPSSGDVKINGSVAALLELGAGFNQEFTGKENVWMSCALLGLTPAEIEAKYQAIADFADIGDFIDQPVKIYSSGMYVRLAFAVNVVSEPEIIIVDEALAVGDMKFQAKCMTALTRLREKGTTVLLVSHDISAVKSLCSRCIYLEHGRIKTIGEAPKVGDLYMRNMFEESNKDITTVIYNAKTINSAQLSKNLSLNFKTSETFRINSNKTRFGSDEATITYAELLNEAGQKISHVTFNQTVLIRIYVRANSDIKLTVGYYVKDKNKIPIISCWSGMLDKPVIIESKKDECYIATYKTQFPLQHGKYSIQLELTIPVILDKATKWIDVIDDAIVFESMPKESAMFWSRVYLPNELDVVTVR